MACKSAAHKNRRRHRVSGQSIEARCRACGRPFVQLRKAGRDLAYCSPSCRRLSHGAQPVVTRRCRQCKSPFTTPRAAQHYCSQACREAAWLAIKKAAYRARIQIFELLCVGCGAPFQATSARGATFRRFCTSLCGRRYRFRQKYDARGGGQRVGRVQGATRLAIFERDGWRCQLCGASIDRRFRFPHPGSPTIDHVIPLAAGGAHDPANWQAAHLICNIEKGNAGRRRSA